MTLFAETSPRIAYLGTGTTTVFAYPFRVLEEHELAVYVDEDLKGLGSHYGLTGIDRATGGTVTFFTPPPLGALVLLMRDMPLTQPVDLREHDALSAETQEREYDRLTMLIQWQEDQHAHMLRLSDLSPTILPTGSLPEPEPGKFLRWHDPTHLDNAQVVSAGSLSIGGDVAGHAAFWVAPQALGGDPSFYWDPARRGLKLARGFHEGDSSILPHKDGPLLVFLKNSDNVAGYNGILAHVHNGAPTDTLSTLGNDKVAIGGWTKRGFGGDSPIYGGNFGVVFDTPGVANGVEIDCQNDSGTDYHGQGLWVNGSGGNHRSNAILIDTQDTTKWFNGIKFTSHFGGGATGCVINAGILFDHNQSQGHIIIVPYDELNPNNFVFELRDSTFEEVKVGISKRGQFLGRASSTGFNQPTFAFVDDQRTGMYSPATHQIAFSTIGFPRLRINDVGDVHIFSLAGSGSASLSVEADGKLVRGPGSGGGGGSPLPVPPVGGASGELRLLELAANGTDYVGFKAPDALAASRIWTLPAIDGSNGQVLTTNGALGLSWSTPAGGGGGGAVTSVGGLAGVIGVTNDVNVTMTSSSPNLVLGWTGTLAPSRGGTGSGGAPPGQAAFWTATGLAGDAAFQWDNAVGGKRLTVGQPNVLTSPSKVLTAAGRSVGGSDPVVQVVAAFAGPGPSNHPVAATFIGDFLGGAQMPLGFGVTIELATHDNLGGGTFIPNAFINSQTTAIVPVSTNLVFGVMHLGAAVPVVAFDGIHARFEKPVQITPLAGSGTAGVAVTADGTLVRGSGGGSGGVTTTGAPATDQFAFFTGANTISSTSLFSFNVPSETIYMTAANLTLGAVGTRRMNLWFYTDNNVNAVSFRAPATATGFHTWTLPSTLGTAGSVMVNDGAGNLSWAAGGAGITGTGAPNQVPFWTGTSTLSGANTFQWNNTTQSLSVTRPGAVWSWPLDDPRPAAIQAIAGSAAVPVTTRQPAIYAHVEGLADNQQLAAIRGTTIVRGTSTPGANTVVYGGLFETINYGIGDFGVIGLTGVSRAGTVGSNNWGVWAIAQDMGVSSNNVGFEVNTDVSYPTRSFAQARGIIVANHPFGTSAANDVGIHITEYGVAMWVQDGQVQIGNTTAAPTVASTGLIVTGGPAAAASVARFEATTGGDTSTRTALALVHSTAAAQIANGYSVRQDFILRDMDAVDNVNARFLVGREGSDATGTFQLQTAIGSVLGDRLIVNGLGYMFYKSPSSGGGVFGFAANGVNRASAVWHTNNDVNAVGFIAPATATGNHLWTLPQALGAADSVLTNDGVGNLSWRNFPTDFPVTDLTMTGRMRGGTAAFFGPAGSINVSGNINAFGTMGCTQYFAAALPGFTGTATVRNAAGSGTSTLTITGGIITGWTP